MHVASSQVGTVEVVEVAGYFCSVFLQRFLETVVLLLLPLLLLLHVLPPQRPVDLERQFN